jgi:hypothetical protein
MNNNFGKCVNWDRENRLKSIGCEFRTKSAESGGLETNGLGERISGLVGRLAVGRFLRGARGYWLLMGDCDARRMLDSDRLAEGDVLGSNVLHLRHRKPTYFSEADIHSARQLSIESKVLLPLAVPLDCLILFS